MPSHMYNWGFLMKFQKNYAGHSQNKKSVQFIFVSIFRSLIFIDKVVNEFNFQNQFHFNLRTSRQYFRTVAPCMSQTSWPFSDSCANPTMKKWKSAKNALRCQLSHSHEKSHTILFDFAKSTTKILIFCIILLSLNSIWWLQPYKMVAIHRINVHSGQSKGSK